MVQVEFIERDSIVTTDAVITQPHPPWGLARLSSRTGNDTEYRYHESAGEGTCVYILGTGVDGSHPVSLSSPLPLLLSATWDVCRWVIDEFYWLL